MIIEDRLVYLEQRQKLVEEELMYCHKDIAHLCDIIESLQKPEYHFHEYIDKRTCTDCKQTDIKDFI
jgi:hypothetical protein